MVHTIISDSFPIFSVSKYIRNFVFIAAIPPVCKQNSNVQFSEIIRNSEFLLTVTLHGTNLNNFVIQTACSVHIRGTTLHGE